MVSPQICNRISGAIQPTSSKVILQLEGPSWNFQKLKEFEARRPIVSVSCIVLDLCRVRHMKTVDFAELLHFRNELGRRSQKLIVQGLQQQPRAVCSLLGLEGLLCDGQADHLT